MVQQMLKGKAAIITGASCGMGRTMAELFGEEGAAAVLTALRQEKLDAALVGIWANGGQYVSFPYPEYDSIDQACACLYPANKIGRHVKSRVLQVCNGPFL